MNVPASSVSYRIFLVRLVLFFVLVLAWNGIGRTESPLLLSVVLIVGCILLVYPSVWLARKMLDQNPTLERTVTITTGIHYVLMLLLGIAIVEAVQTQDAWKGVVLPVPEQAGQILLILTGGLLAMTVLNLAIRGLGAPFALALSHRLASDWLYAWTRNPMLLAVLAFLVALGLFFRSGLFLCWVLLLVTPAWIFFVRHFEEKELEIRFGSAYLEYKQKTSFLLPRRPKVSDPVEVTEPSHR